MNLLAGPTVPADPPPTRPIPAERVREGFRSQRMTVLPRTLVRHGEQVKVIRELFVTDIGHYPCARGHYVDRPEGRKENILIYCMAGRGWCEMEGSEWRPGAGWALVIPSGVPHVYGADAEDPWSIWWVHFGGAMAPDFLEILGVSAARPVLYAPDNLRVGDAFEDTYAHLQAGYSDMALLGLGTGLGRVLGLLKTRQRAPDARGRSGEDRILRTVAYMRENLERPVRLGELADLLGLTVPHYSTLFRRVMGDSPGRFLTHLKMRRACELLDTSDALIVEIARQVGYDDPFHFSRAFKKVVGKSPTRYRDSVKG